MIMMIMARITDSTMIMLRVDGQKRPKNQKWPTKVPDGKK